MYMQVEGAAATITRSARGHSREPSPHRAHACQHASLGRLLAAPLRTLQDEDGDTFLLAARRRKGKKGHSFIISSDAHDIGKGPNYVAKLRSPHCTLPPPDSTAHVLQHAAS